MKKESFSKGVVYMLISASGLAIVGLLAKIGMNEFSVLALIFWRFFASFFICFLFFLIKNQLKGFFNFKDIKLQLLRVLFLLGAQYSFFYYLHKNTLLNATVLLNTGPLFIPLIEKCILGNKVGKSTWIAIVISFIGMLCILQPDGGIFSLMSFIGLFAGISQGASQVVFGMTSKKENVEINLLHLFLLCMLATMIPYLCAPSTWLVKEELVTASVLLIIGIGIASMCNQLSRAVAYANGSPSRLSPFFYISVILAGLFDWLIFHKTPNTLSIIGAALVFLGAALKIYLRKVILRKK